MNLPKILEDLKSHEELFAIAGMHGCIGSTDSTDVPMLNCVLWAANNHKGCKFKIPAQRHNVTVNHSRYILNATCGHPASWNDKTIVLYDELVRSVHNSEIY